MQALWRWEQLVWFLLHVLSAAPASTAAWTADAAEHLRELRVKRSTFLGRGSASSSSADVAAKKSPFDEVGEEELYSMGNLTWNSSMAKWKKAKAKTVPSQNYADRTRGTGQCKAWRATTDCEPSGPRDQTKDKACDEVVMKDESGYCECGDYVQFAASPCGHNVFTCDVMCLKFAVVSNKPAFYKGQFLSRDEAQAALKLFLHHNGADLVARSMLLKDVISKQKAMMIRAQKLGDEATEAVDKYMAIIKEARKKQEAKDNEAKEAFERMKVAPWNKLRWVSNRLIHVGQGIQAKVRELMPQAFESDDLQGSVNATMVAA